VANLNVLIFDNFVSHGTFGIQSLNDPNAAFIDCVLLLSFLFDPTIFLFSVLIGPMPSPWKNKASC